MKNKSIHLFLLTLTLLTACGSDEPERLAIQISGLQEAREQSFFRTFVRLFEAENGIKVDLKYTNAEDLIDAIDLEQASEVVTDVIMTNTAHMYHYVDHHYMEDISYLDRDTYRSFVNFFDAYTHVDNARYFVPVSFDIYLSIFNRAALPYMPETVVATYDNEMAVERINHLTWQDMSAWAKNIKTATGLAKFGFATGRSGAQLIYPLTGIAGAMGPHYLPSFTDSGATKMWDYLDDLQQAGALANGPRFSSYSQPDELLRSNDLWMSFAHMGPLGQVYVEDSDKFVLGPTPIDETTNFGASTAGAWAYGVQKGSKNLRAARKWLEFITDPEINHLYCSGLGGVISPIKEVEAYLGNTSTDEIMKIGLSMFSQNMNVIMVETSGFSSWNSVKLLYNDLYAELLSGTPIESGLLETYQDSLDELRVA